MGSRPVVLVADDSRAIRAWLRRSLGEAFEVVEAADGSEAVRHARLVRPDVILLDVDMPEMDGLQALALIRVEPSLANVPVLFLTGRTGADDVVEGLSLGATDYLRKPCEPAELVARVEGALRTKSRYDELEQNAVELTRATTTDDLTGLANRRAVSQQLPELVAQAGRTDQPVAVIVVDIDHFKRVNDTEGHLVGDAVLIGVARRLASAMRPDQLVARWGGEEFVVISPRTTLADAVVLGERLRGVVGWEPVAVDDVRSVDVTVSVGVASGRHDGHRLLQEADAAVYVAKAQGRNCVRSATPAGTAPR